MDYCQRPKFSVLVFALSVSLLVVISCGGGGGSGDESPSTPSAATTFSGTLSTDSATVFTRAANAVPGISISALGQLATTDSVGAWQFEVGQNLVPTASDILFSIQGVELDTSVVVPALSTQNPEAVELDIVLDDEAMASLAGLFVNGANVSLPEAPDPEPTPGPTPLPDDDACTILRSVNVAIIGTRDEEIRVSDQLETCQSNSFLGDVIIPANPQQLSFNYIVGAVPDYILFGEDDLKGTIEPGDNMFVDGNLECERVLNEVPVQEESVLIEITVTIESVNFEDGTVRTADELIDECGPNSPVGNLSESFSIPLFVTSSSS